MDQRVGGFLKTGLSVYHIDSITIWTTPTLHSNMYTVPVCSHTETKRQVANQELLNFSHHFKNLARLLLCTLCDPDLKKKICEKP